MSEDSFQQLILAELRDLKNEIKEVRLTDIPAVNIAIAGFHTEIENLKTSQKWSTRVYTIIGGAIAVMIAKFTGHN